MSKRYVIWWHSKFVDEISRENTTIQDITDKTSKILGHLEKLKVLEEEGKITVEDTGTLNPIIIKILDSSIEPEVVNNPIVEVEEI